MIGAPGRPSLPSEYWRIFPWDRDARAGAPFSPYYVPPVGSQTGGRFDLNGNPAVLYLAETPVHAVCEVLRRYRGRSLHGDQLVRRDRRNPGNAHPLALARAYLPRDASRKIADLCDVNILHALGVPPDRVASANRPLTQRISRDIHQRGNSGLRWWSALRGDWHVTVLFLDRVPSERIGYDRPEPLTTTHAYVLEAAEEVGLVPPSAD